MKIANHYSMLWGAIIIMGLVIYFILRRGFKPTDVILVLAAAAVLLISWLVLRPDQATISEYGQFQADLGQGQAVLLELQSPY
jgi:preprotein translocase subunit YajC